MAIKPPFTDMNIKKAPSGFYEGNSIPIALLSKGHHGCPGTLGAGLAG